MELRTIKENMVREAEKCGGEIYFNYPLKTHSSIGIGGKTEVYFVPASEGSLISVRKYFRKTGKSIIVIGKASNLLIPDKGIEGMVITLKNDVFSGVSINGVQVLSGGGLFLPKLIDICIEKGLGGLEGLAGIPASVGGSVFMNASYKVAVSDVLAAVKVLKKNNEIVWVKKNDMRFDYRKSSFREGDIILEALFDLKLENKDALRKRYNAFLKHKSDNQPLGRKTLGCVFKNPIMSGLSAGELIERVGMKGAAIGDAVVSDKHANFIINNGHAGSKDIIDLMKEVQASVQKRFSIKLEPEIKIL